MGYASREQNPKQAIAVETRRPSYSSITPKIDNNLFQLPLRNETHFSKHSLDIILKEFNTFSLADSGGDTLMRRKDSKFIVDQTDVGILLRQSQQHFSCLEIDEDRQFEYENTYFDTKDLMFYRHHHQNRKNRYKVRVRNYVNSGLFFLEVKLKNNKGVTVKERIRVNGGYDHSLSLYHDFLSSTGLDITLPLSPSLSCRYDRIALSNEDFSERVTIDLNFRSNLLNLKPASLFRLPDIAIIEVKQARIDRNSHFYSMLRQLHYRPTQFSKYCIGFYPASKKNQQVKFNRFKRQLRLISNASAKQDTYLKHDQSLHI